jgi:hypothetical protein
MSSKILRKSAETSVSNVSSASSNSTDGVSNAGQQILLDNAGGEGDVGQDSVGGMTTRLGLARALLDSMGLSYGPLAADAGAEAVNQNIFTAANDLHLNDPVIRDEAAKMVSETNNLTQLSEGEIKRTFPDVRANTWSAPYIYGAVLDGVLKGYTDGEFKPTERLEHQWLQGFVDRAASPPGSPREGAFDPRVAVAPSVAPGPMSTELGPMFAENTEMTLDWTRVLVDVTIFHGVDKSEVDADFAAANAIFNPYGIELVSAGWTELSKDQTKELLGWDRKLDIDPGGSGELTDVLNNINTGSGIAATWVRDLDYYKDIFFGFVDTESTRGLTVTPESTSPGMVVTDVDGRASDTFAHEIAHCLAQDTSSNSNYNAGGHIVDDPDNLLASGASRNIGAGQLTDEQVRAFKTNGAQYS